MIPRLWSEHPYLFKSDTKREKTCIFRCSFFLWYQKHMTWLLPTEALSLYCSAITANFSLLHILCMRPVYLMQRGWLYAAGPSTWSKQPQRANRTRHIHARLHSKHTVLPAHLHGLLCSEIPPKCKFAALTSPGPHSHFFTLHIWCFQRFFSASVWSAMSVFYLHGNNILWIPKRGISWWGDRTVCADIFIPHTNRLF